MTDTARDNLTELFGVIAWAETPELRTAAEDAIRAMLKPRTITTVEELDALAVGSVVLDRNGLSLHKNILGHWNVPNGVRHARPEELESDCFPATLLHDGADGGGA